MPLEIKELLIKVAVGGEPQDNEADIGGTTGESDPATIQKIVDQVLEVLKKNKER